MIAYCIYGLTQISPVTSFISRFCDLLNSLVCPTGVVDMLAGSCSTIIPHGHSRADYWGYEERFRWRIWLSVSFHPSQPPAFEDSINTLFAPIIISCSTMVDRLGDSYTSFSTENNHTYVLHQVIHTHTQETNVASWHKNTSTDTGQFVRELCP